MTLALTCTLAEGGLMPTVSLVVFFALFAAIVAYVFVIPKSVWQKDAQLPLDKPDSPNAEKESRRE